MLYFLLFVFVSAVVVIGFEQQPEPVSDQSAEFTAFTDGFVGKLNLRKQLYGVALDASAACWNTSVFSARCHTLLFFEKRCRVSN